MEVATGRQPVSETLPWEGGPLEAGSGRRFGNGASNQNNKMITIIIGTIRRMIGITRMIGP